jgi:methyltransferase (TIGR00027 family)
MENPSQTALAAATHRATHQILENGRIFADPLALRILGGRPEAEDDVSKRRIRIFIAVRTRFAEDCLAEAVARGVRQLVILGAGLDTYAYRSPFADRLRIFEVDHPATQAWKRERLKAAAIPVPDYLSFVPVDFERETLAQGLSSAGFDVAKETFFTWLGVVPYLREGLVWSTLGFIGSLPNGAHVVFDYSNPPDSLPADRRREHEERAMRVAQVGESWVTYFESDMLRAKLTALGFSGIEDLGPRQMAERFFPSRANALSDKGGHILHAMTIR